MKSFEKFQYDTSPYEIDEEVEELDEDLVGMVKQGIKATGNVLNKGSEQLKKVGTAVNKGIKSGANIVSNAATPTRKYEPGQQRGSSPSPAPTAPVTKRRNIKSKEFKNPDGSVNQEKYAAAGANRQKQKPAPTSTRRYQAGQQRGAPDPKGIVPQNKKQVNPENKITSAVRKVLPDREKREGGLRSSLARNVASVGKQIYKGITAQPETKIAYDAKGSGFGGPTMGVGKNIQQAAKNVGDANLYKPSKVDSKTGRVTKGDVKQTVSDKFGLTNIMNKGKGDKKVTGTTSVGGSAAGYAGIKDIFRSRNNKSKGSAQVTTSTRPSEEESRTIKKQFPQKPSTVSEPTARTNQDSIVKRRQAGSDAQQDQMDDQILADRKKKRITQVDAQGRKKKKEKDYESTRGRGDIEPQMDVSKYGKGKTPADLTKPKKPKTKDGFPTGKDATHWLDAQKQHSSKTPKLFEQFLFEIDTRSTKKKKKDGRGMHPHDEIKPMSGTNTITINPEDETSKYKRGY